MTIITITAFIIIAVLLIFISMFSKALKEANRNIRQLERENFQLRAHARLNIKEGIFSSVGYALNIKVRRRKELRKALTAAMIEQHNEGKSINILTLMYRMDELAENQNERAWLNYQIGRAVYGIEVVRPRASQSINN